MAQPWCRKLGRRRSQELEEEEGREATWLPGWRDRWRSQVHAPVPQLRQKVHYQERQEPGTRPPSRSTEQHCGTQGTGRSSQLTPLPQALARMGPPHPPGPAPGQGAGGEEEWVGERQKEGERGWLPALQLDAPSSLSTQENQKQKGKGRDWRSCDGV